MRDRRSERDEVEMERGLVPAPGGEPADLHGAPLDELPAMPGTSEQARPVDGVRVPPPDEG